MIVTTHQPIFLPWPGFFCKAMCADAMILLDCVQFPWGASWMTRNRVKSEQGDLWLRVPVWKKHLGKQIIRDVQICEETAWRGKHLRSLREKYANAPYVADFLPALESIYSAGHDRLAAFNTGLIQYLWDALGLRARLILQSELGVSGAGTELLVSLCRALQADAYVTLPPVAKYIDSAGFQNSGIALRFLRFHPPVYPQLYGEFRYNLSGLDLLFNCGPKSRDVLKRCCVA